MRYKLLLISAVFLLPLSASAAVRITEIMYDTVGADAGREWIEVINEGTMPIDLSTYRVFEGGVNHRIIAHRGDALIPVGGMAIITDNPTKFLVDWPSTPGSILDSAFALSNSGETISIKDRDLVVDDAVTYAAKGASGNGLSLARGFDKILVPAHATPGRYDAYPVRVSMEPVTAPETSEPKPELPSKTQSDDEQVSQQENQKEIGGVIADGPPASVWVWILGVLGLCLLGAGALYALRMQENTAQKDQGKVETQKALQKEADTYEITEK